ncbi:MAG: serine hydrolase domain-containing protein [Crocinitomicaceae bacterium]
MTRLRLLLLFAIFCQLYVHGQKEILIDQEEINSIIVETDSILPFNGVLGILQQNKKPIIFYHGYQSPIHKKILLDSTDYFYLASNSKLFTGLATLKMMKDYNLKFDDQIGPYFPELDSNLKKITIQQLANHTCAIHDYFSMINEPFEVTNEQALKLIYGLHSTVYEPGLKWGYTNSGYVLLSELVERVSQMAYNDYLDKEILSIFEINNAQLNPDVSGVLKGYIHHTPSVKLSVTTGDAGIYLKTADLINFFRNQAKVLDFAKQAYNWSSPWKNNGWRYGFGWFFSEDSIGKFRAHAGKSSGFESYIRIYESNQLMIFVLSNNENGSAKMLREKIIKKLNATKRTKH